MHILVAEPDPEMLEYLETSLGKERFSVYGTREGEEALDLGKLYDYDAIMLELDLPDLSGFDVIRRLRDARKKTPILVLSRAARVDDKVRALDLGADDYMTKPFDKSELLARLTAIMRRSKGVTQRVITVGEVSLDLNAMEANAGGVPLNLSGSEYKILRVLMLSVGTVQSKERIFNALYGGTHQPDSRIIEVFICKVRKKLAAAGVPRNFIETVHGRGFMVGKRPAVSMEPEVADLIGSFDSYRGSFHASALAPGKRHPGAA